MTEIVITFAGGNLDRATAVRVNPEAMAAALASAKARFVPVWRQRCLVDKTGACLPTAAELGTASPVADDPILLGRRDDHWLFAAELQASHEPVLAPGQVFAELRAGLAQRATRDQVRQESFECAGDDDRAVDAGGVGPVENYC